MSTTNQHYEKTISEQLAYGIDWTTLLDAEDDGNGDTISTSDWVSTPTGLTLAGGAIDLEAKRALITASGGADGMKYTLVNTIVTANGSTIEDFIEVSIREYA